MPEGHRLLARLSLSWVCGGLIDSRQPVMSVWTKSKCKPIHFRFHSVSTKYGEVTEHLAGAVQC